VSNGAVVGVGVSANILASAQVLAQRYQVNPRTASRSRHVISDLIVFKRSKEQNAGGVLTVSPRAPVF
jgi:hypothetical protein